MDLNKSRGRFGLKNNHKYEGIFSLMVHSFENEFLKRNAEEEVHKTFTSNVELWINLSEKKGNKIWSKQREVIQKLYTKNVCL